MKLISHRGNINGRIENYENNPDYIDDTIRLGYDVEIDIWVVNGLLFLGHDEPQYGISVNWINERKKRLWIHCKNIDAIEFTYWFKDDESLNFFWHQEDTLTLTSKGYIWAYPGKQPIKNSIAVMPEIHNDNVDYCIGICSDYISKFKKVKTTI
jgi:hypothetical protein